MPADTEATRYEWYMTSEPSSRVIKIVWTPEHGRIQSSMTPGPLKFMIRGEEYAGGDDDNAGWEDHPKMGEMLVPWVVAQSFARNQGFHIEQSFRDDGPGISGGKVSWKTDDDCLT